MEFIRCFTLPNGFYSLFHYSTSSGKNAIMVGEKNKKTNLLDLQISNPQAKNLPKENDKISTKLNGPKQRQTI